MARENYRYINSTIWDDEWFRGATALGRLFFLYLLTNPLANGDGVYKTTLSRMAFDTGIDESDLKRFLQKFDDDGRVFYEIVDGTGYIIIKNVLRHQRYNLNGWKSVANNLNSLPEQLIKQITDPKHKLYLRFDKINGQPLSIVNDKEPFLIIANDSEPLRTNTNTNTDTDTPPTPQGGNRNGARPIRPRRRGGI